MKSLNKEMQNMWRERCCCTLRHYPVIFLRWLWKAMTKFVQDIRHTGQISKQEPIKQVTNLTTLFILLGTKVRSFLDKCTFIRTNWNMTRPYRGSGGLSSASHCRCSVRYQATSDGCFGAQSRKMTDPSPSTSVFSTVSSILPCSSLTHSSDSDAT